MAETRVLLTGASGFIAKHIAFALLGGGYLVRGTVRSRDKGEALRRSLASAGADVARLEIAVADLLCDDGWDAAAEGCGLVCHAASPLPLRQPREKFALTPAAKGGALRVVAAAARAGATRLVLTSSVAAMSYGHGRARGDAPFGEDDWSDVTSKSISPYAVSKTEAEAAARDAASKAGLDMVAINPAVVLGPLLDDEFGASMRLVRMMMRGKMPAVPDVRFGVVDVRDVAAAHVGALTAEGAAGRRFALSAGSLSLMEMGQAIAAAVPECRGKVPRLRLPDLVVRLAALVVPDLRAVVGELGRGKGFDTDPARRILGFAPAEAARAVEAAAVSLMQRGLAG
ncbi:NAD-dependent epimerase/dehydratase family protein [Jiella sonneratiae]|uniref:NAD-dependent epimerase/dehydratase family protein n=1 Tax=Jiella sonneratiae TaxID=2816856 RepID=A0ABS3IYY0_9HYPH|nr:NAD-dependent epimerase/dehydratase family protein [Jiella sonneratiae]MBO0902624.1 NAD-dependent epimerase/dehydratase family protein [Jiella sonneratiae]